MVSCCCLLLQLRLANTLLPHNNHTLLFFFEMCVLYGWLGTNLCGRPLYNFVLLVVQNTIPWFGNVLLAPCHVEKTSPRHGVFSNTQTLHYLHTACKVISNTPPPCPHCPHCKIPTKQQQTRVFMGHFQIEMQ